MTKRDTGIAAGAKVCIWLTICVGLTGCATVDTWRFSDARNTYPRGLTAKGADSRVDLQWEPSFDRRIMGYNIYRATSATGEVVQINDKPHPRHLYSDFFGENAITYWYEVTAVYKNWFRRPSESIPSRRVHGTSYPMDEEQLLTSVQEATFRYFWDYGHPVSGMARERSGNNNNNMVTTGGTGFGLMNFIVGSERNFVSRKQAAERTLKILTFLEEKADRLHGVWSHWLDGRTGEIIPFSDDDDGADLVESAFLMQGILAVREYFDSHDDIVEKEIRERAQRLWEEMEWSWFQKDPSETALYWHYSRKHGWKKNLRIVGFNECMMVYLLAIASPTYPVDPGLYETGWVGDSDYYVNGNEFYGIHQPVGFDMGGPLFFTHYSFLGFDPRGKRDAYCNYFENNRNISLIHRQFSIANPNNHKDYGENVWGLTASINPWGYRAQAPNDDNGTITPTACLSAMAYTPEESIAALKHLYHTYGPRLWGEFGFRDAFNPTQDWYCDDYLAIDQGTIAPMIENYRTELCWNTFMRAPEIHVALERMGWTLDPVK